MKSLKRTLCLVLALVMVLGLFGIASASSFTDDNAIQYKEAVDVMTAIGAINGYNDGSFGPKGTITRAEAAKLITYTVLGEDAAKRLTSDISPFTDVTEAGGYGWAIPSIAYLTKLGVINGRGDGTFDPAGQITGYAVGKMLLCALGYGAKGEYTGTGWDFQVAVDGGKYGIFDDRAPGSSALSAPATREEVALYCLNTIQKPMVEYVSTLDIYRNLGTTALGATNKTIMNSIYDRLVKVPYTSGTDAFGNPANVWSYGTKAIGAYPVEATFTYTAETKADAIAKDLKNFTIAGEKWRDGCRFGHYNDDEWVYTPITTAAAIADLTGNGTTVNVYTQSGYVTKVVVIDEVLAEVAYVDTAKETVQLTTVQGTVGGTLAASGSVSLTTPVGYGKVKTGDYVVITVKAAVSDGNLVLTNNVEVKTVNPANIVTGTATKTSVDGKSITVGGTVYKAAASYNMSAFKVTDKSDATIVLDSFGYIMFAKEGKTISRDNILAVTDVYQTLSDGKITNMVKGYTSDGQEVALVDAGQTPLADTAKGTIVTYTEKASGGYEFGSTPTNRTGAETYKPEEVDGNATPYAFATTLTANIDKTTKAAGTTVNTSTALKYYFSSDIKFIFAKAEVDPDNPAEVTVLNGVQNVAAKNDQGVTLNQRVVYALKPAGKTYEVSAVFVIEGEPDTVASAASDLIFLAKVDGERAVDGKVYNNYTMLKAGMPVQDAYGTTNYSVGSFYTGIKDDATGAWKLKAFGFGKNNLQAQPASLVQDLSNEKNLISSAIPVVGQGGITYAHPVTLDISKATIINLDTEAMGSKEQIAAGLAQFKADVKDNGLSGVEKLPMIAAIYDEDANASIVYYFTLDNPLYQAPINPGQNEEQVTVTIAADADLQANGVTVTVTGNKTVKSYQWQSYNEITNGLAGTGKFEWREVNNSRFTGAATDTLKYTGTGNLGSETWKIKCVVTFDDDSTAESNDLTITIGS